MENLKKLLNPLNIPYATQSEILRVIEGDNLAMLSESDFLDALKLQGEVQSLRFAPHELENQQNLDENLKGEIIHAKTIFIIIEMLEDEPIEKYRHIIDYIYSAVKDDVTVLFDTKIVTKILYEPMTILLFGYENSEKLLLHVGDNFAEFWQKNSEYCLDEFKQMRQRASRQMSEPLTPIRITSSNRSSNMVELVDVQSFQALRVFEFNEQTKDEFILFCKKLESAIINYHTHK